MWGWVLGCWICIGIFYACTLEMSGRHNRSLWEVIIVMLPVAVLIGLLMLILYIENWVVGGRNEN